MLTELFYGRLQRNISLSLYGYHACYSHNEPKGMNMNKMVILGLILSALFLASCATSMTAKERKNATTKTYETGFSSVFDAVLEAYEQDGFTIANVDSNVGLVSTDWKQEEGLGMKILMGSIRYKMSSRVKRTSENQSTITCSVQGEKQRRKGWESVKMNIAETCANFFSAVDNILLN